MDTLNTIVSPKKYLRYREKIGKGPRCNIPKGIIFCYQQSLINHIENNHKTTKDYGFTSELQLLNDTNNQIGIFTRIEVGAPIVTMLLEQMIAFGVKKFITIGTAGTLQEDINIGELIICDSAIREEGTSNHYLKKSKYAYASKGMTEKIKKSFQKYNQDYKIGSSWTTDAPYRETIVKAKKYQKEGIVTVDMESSALFSVAKFRNVQMGAIFTISDSLAKFKWNPQHFHPSTEKGLEKIYKIAVNALLN